MTDKPELDLSIFDGHTPGPWWFTRQPYEWNEKSGGLLMQYRVVDGRREYTKPVTREWLDKGVLAINPADCFLIETAPDLLAEVKRLRAENEALRDMVRYLQRPPLSHMQTIEALEADKSYVEHQLAQSDNDPWGTVRLMWQSRLAEINRQIAGVRGTK